MAETDVGAAAGKAKRVRSPPAHPPFIEMITAAIVALKERTGSSQYAITKYVEEKQKNLPPTFRKLLLYHLKKLVAAGKLVKVKNSYKLPSARSALAKEKTAAVEIKPKKSAAAGGAVAKPKAKATKAKTVAKPKSKVVVKPKSKAKAAAKPKAASAAPAKVKAAAAAAAKPVAKAARTSTRTSPGKKVEVKAKAKKAVTPSKAVKKPKSVKSPAKKKAPVKKAKK